MEERTNSILRERRTVRVEEQQDPERRQEQIEEQRKKEIAGMEGIGRLGTRL